MRKRILAVLVVGILSGGWVAGPKNLFAEWTVRSESALFYTDDVGLFSSSRRLSLQEDPTQPVIDHTGLGEDVVLEPIATVANTWHHPLGKTTLFLRGQGFVFFDQSEFSHATYGVKVEQTVPSGTTLGLRYHYGPNLFLGKNEERRSGSRQMVDERVTTQFISWTVEQDFINENVTFRLLGRYGSRTYQENFSQRDTNFWTIGSHLDWKILPAIDFTLGYHYERGLAEGRKEPQFMDDVSYVNHYVSSEVGIDIWANTTLELALHYERNNFTNTLVGDERQGTDEEVWQGDMEVLYEVADGRFLNIGFQRSQRKASFDSRAVVDVNAWLGGQYEF